MDFFTWVVNCVPRGWNYLQKIQFEEKLDDLRISMEHLKTQRDSVKTTMEEDGLLGRISTIDGWLKSVGNLEKDVAAVLQEGDRLLERCCICVCLPWNCWNNESFGKKVMTKISLVNQTMNRGNFPELAGRRSPIPVQEMPVDLPIIGLDASLDTALRFVQQDGVRILGLYGPGGVGKTTLLKKINNSFLGRSLGFDIVIWAVVSKEVSMELVQKRIGDCLGLSWPDSVNINSRAHDITNKLGRKKFLLLLDDIWERIVLTDIGVPLPSSENKSKIIFTTRSYAVCGLMEATGPNTIRVECLDEIQAWNLFESKVGVVSNEIKQLAKIVAEECGGLPLALTVIGRTVASKKTIPEWKVAIRDLHAGKLTGTDKEVFSVLKYSYDELADDSTRSCFLFCSIYPGDYNIEIKTLVDQWIGKGYINIDDFDEWEEAVNTGHRIIGDLKAVSLLESSERDDCVKLQNVIRDMAHWIEKDKILVIPAAGFGEAGKTEKLKKAQSITVTTPAGLQWLGDKPDCPYLTTLLITISRSFEFILPDDFFLLMQNLDFVDITGLLDVPTSICKLVSLECLRLCFLRRGRAMTELPSEMKNMVRLKHLRWYALFYGCTMPMGFIGHLSNLRSIRLDAREDHMDGTETHAIQDLGGLNKLICLDITIRTVKYLEFFLKSQQLMHRTMALTFQDYVGYGNKGLIKLALSQSSSCCLSVGCMKRLQYLRIDYCLEMDELFLNCSSDTQIPLFQSLEVLELQELPKLVVTWDIRNNLQSQCFRNLHQIVIFGCHSMVDVTWLHLAPNLQKLFIRQCNGLKEIISNVSGACEEITFSSLKKLELYLLPNLMLVCVNVLHLPSLEVIRVYRCPGVRRLPLKPNNKLRSIRGEQEWWNNLEWESETTKSALAQLYTI